MKKIFPNIETAIIFVFLIIVMLWGVSKCSKKKAEVSANLPNNESMAYDSLSSPAARSTKANPATLPQPTVATTPTNTLPSQYSTPVTTPPPSTPAQTVQQPLPQATTTTSALPPPKTPSAPPVTVVPPTTQNGATTANSGLTSLYVLQNGLNVRTKPELKAKSLGKLKLHDQVYFLNEVTEAVETVRLIDGTEITKPWFKIKTKKGTVGWVHGSGVDFYKRKPKEGL